MRRRTRDQLMNFLTLCIALFLPYAYAQRPDYELLEWQKNKLWWWSSDAPMTKALNEIPDVVNGMKSILDHFERVEQSILSTFDNSDSANYEAFLKPCQFTGRQRWPRAIRSNFGARGFPEPDTSCITDFAGVQFSPEEDPPYTVDELYDAILRRGHAIKANIKSIASRFIDVETNYTDPDFVFNYPYHTTGANCVLHPVNAVRVDDRWRLATGIHNRPISQGLPFLDRRKVVEYARVVDGKLADNLLMRLPVRPENGTERIFREDATTLISSGRGQANPSLFRFMPISENPAITDILNKASRSIFQAENARVSSNIATLVLPLVLNIIPISLFVDVSILKMLVYIFLSDVLTTIPILLRSVELLRISGRPYRSIVTRLSSSASSSRSESAAGELWAAECTINGCTQTLGTILLSVSVGFLIGGIALELGAKWYLQRRNRRLRKIIEQRIKSSSPDKQDSDDGPSQAGNVNEDHIEGVVDSLTSSGDKGVVDSRGARGAASDGIERNLNQSNLRRRKGKQT